MQLWFHSFILSFLTKYMVKMHIQHKIQSNTWHITTIHMNNLCTKMNMFKDIWAWDGHASWWPMGVTIPWVMPAGDDSLYQVNRRVATGIPTQWFHQWVVSGSLPAFGPCLTPLPWLTASSGRENTLLSMLPKVANTRGNLGKSSNANQDVWHHMGSLNDNGLRHLG